MIRLIYLLVVDELIRCPALKMCGGFLYIQSFSSLFQANEHDGCGFFRWIDPVDEVNKVVRQINELEPNYVVQEQEIGSEVFASQLKTLSREIEQIGHEVRTVKMILMFLIVVLAFVVVFK